MKHGELVRQINAIAKAKGLTAVWAEGGKHGKVRIGDRQTTVPRGSDVNELTAKGLLRYLKEAK